MVIDHIDRLHLPENKAQEYFNELRSLDYLARGLWFLYYQVRNMEAKITEGVGKDKQVFIFGNAPELKAIPQDLVACAFHWYAVTVCNYIKMVGWLAYDHDSSKATNYLEKVIPTVKLWRDKVGAHFARTSPRKDDTPADLAKSVMFPLSFDDNAFYAASFTLTLGSRAKSSTTSRDMRWSLTHTHHALIPRYWPGSTPKVQG
jgi:hypothetical protein